MAFTDEQLRRVMENRQIPEAKLIGSKLNVKPQSGTGGLVMLKRYKNVPTRCAICDRVIGLKKVTLDFQPAVALDICDNPTCRRTHNWGLYDNDQRSGAAKRAGVGDLFIRDGEPPTLAQFSPSNEIKWDRSSYICGVVGTGKTWALSAIICDALSFGRTARLVNSQWFMLEVRDTYKTSAKETELDILNRYIRPDVLCVDDLGAGKKIDGKESEAARVLMYILLDKRYARQKITHISSNLRPKDLAGTYDDRIARRVDEICKAVILTERIK